ncbi:hypothetical protein CBR_g44503 [Chara braunii]|uniref:Uncharacterized protein n=1 Tax=Chara braunii TaxID=69332 RepID=A0A388LXK9_CHABU|nr:hypothetical protein CBR_g44503 [Chara braunii]|eukprot:GBG87046.1 hypothetical protein CBR_g44503 [Chara braunii]
MSAQRSRVGTETIVGAGTERYEGQKVTDEDKADALGVSLEDLDKIKQQGSQSGKETENESKTATQQADSEAAGSAMEPPAKDKESG